MNEEGMENREEHQPELPSGYGISLEDIAVLLAMKHDTSVRKDDPVLMLVTICNSFLGAVQSLYQKHNTALSSILTARTKEYISGVKNTTDALSKTLSDASVEAIRTIFDEHAFALQASKRNARWCALIVAASTVANIITLALR